MAHVSAEIVNLSWRQGFEFYFTTITLGRAIPVAAEYAHIRVGTITITASLRTGTRTGR